MSHAAMCNTPTSVASNLICFRDPTKSDDSTQLPPEPASRSPLENSELIRYVLSYVGPGHYRFVAAINRQFHLAYQQVHPDDYRKTYLRVTSLDLAAICYEESTEQHRSLLCRCAARYGNLEVLQYFRSRGCGWDASTCHTAAKYGHLPILRYAHQQQCPWGKHTLYYAAIHGHVHILLWAQMNGCPWDEDHIVRGAVYMNQKKNLIDYLHQQINLE